MRLTIGETKEMLNFMADKIISQEPMLTEIDSKIGDGDHGIGMKIGFMALKEQLPGAEPESINDLFKWSGMTILDAMGGASGVIFGTLFISGYTAVEKVDYLDLDILAQMFEKSLEAIKLRGKAKVGDKTMVDSLEPAVHVLSEMADKKSSFRDGTAAAAKAAWQGVERTKTYEASKGRAQSYGDQSIGLPDPGAVSAAILMEGIAEFIEKREEVS